MVATHALGRLPGITFETRARDLPDALPRMDVAAFVGLAASGPVDLPVAIEDLARFSDIFGGDLPLAHDRATGADRYAYLAPAVETFFRNGGQRCWIVRVARGGSANRFGVPGLLQPGVEPSSWRLATAFARSVGSWSDTLRVGAVLDRRALPAPTAALDPLGRTLDLETSGGVVELGDLLSVAFPLLGLRIFLVANEIDTSSAMVRVRWSEQDEHWFRTDALAASPPLTFGRVRLLDVRPRTVPVTVHQRADGSGFEMDVDTGAGDTLAVGDVLEVEVNGRGRLLLTVGDPVVGVESEQGDAIRRHAGTGLFELTPDETSNALATSNVGSELAELLRLELVVWRGEQLVARLPDLGLGHGHRRCWDALPADHELFASGIEGVAAMPGASPAARRRHKAANDDTPTRPPRSDVLWADASIPIRFPLSSHAPEGVPDVGSVGGVRASGAYLPVGIPPLPQLTRSRGAAEPGDARDRLARDGLAEFDSGLFLDTDLATVGAASLLEVAHAKAYVRGDALRGLHSLLPLEEVTLVAVPDAVQPGWRFEHEPLPDLIGAPHLRTAGHHGGAATLQWTAVTGAERYECQRALQPDFAGAVIEQHAGDGARTTVVTARSTSARRYWVRVRALRASRHGPWSNTESLTVPVEPFEPCLRPVANAPGLTLQSQGATVDLAWSATATPRVTIEEAGDPAFLTSRVVFAGAGDAVTLHGRHDGPFYYRARGEDPGDAGADVVGPWSATVVHTAPSSALVMRDGAEAGAATLVTVHRALLRFATARRDLLAVLALPDHYDERDAARYPGVLAADLAAAGEETILGFGAVYHPWVAVRTRRLGPSVFRSLPPDGVVTGLIAARTLDGGAWLPAANEPLAGVVGLTPEIGGDGLEALLSAQVNPLVRDPTGFLVAGVDTLGRDRDRRAVNIRRLLILLRRLALRHGATHVFAPHDEDFRRLVRRSFEGWLSELYLRGAFVGLRPSEGYRVVVDDSVNTPGSVEQGRFVVELHVAPAQPLRFITIRLIHGGDGVAVEER